MLAAMEITILAFAQARDHLGFSERQMAARDGATADEVLASLDATLREALPTMRVAVDEVYASWDTPLGDGQTLALIPPVSGG